MLFKSEKQPEHDVAYESECCTPSFSCPLVVACAKTLSMIHAAERIIV
jgi:hypothetical protein